MRFKRTETSQKQPKRLIGVESSPVSSKWLKIGLIAFIITLISINLIPLSSGALTDNLIEYWKMENATGNITGELGNYNLVRARNPILNTSSTGCKRNNCYSVNGTGGASTNPDTFQSPVITHLNTTDDVCLAMWADFTGFSDGYWMIHLSNTGSNYKLASQSTGATGMKFINPAGTPNTALILDFTGIHHYAFCHQENTGTTGTLTIYQDGILVANQTYNGTGDNNPILTFVAGSTGSFGAGNSIVRQLIDEVGLWERKLTNAEITQLSAGTEVSYYPFNLPIPIPTFINPLVTDTRNNTQINITWNCTGYGLNSYLYFDNNTNPTTPVLSNSSYSYWFTNVTQENKYYFKASCYNATANIQGTNSSIFAWSYDTTFPTITILNSNGFTSNNESRVNQYGDTLIINLTLTDNLQLYGYRLNITRAGVILWNETNLTLSGTTHNLYKNINTSRWSAGDYNIELIVADAHTANAISNYQITNKKSFIQFKTTTGNNIKVESRDSSTISATKLTDRYTFNINFDDGLTTDRTFDIKSECALTYLPNSPYKAHFVSFCNDNGNWIDFEGANNNPIVTRIDDYHYSVYFSNLPPNIVFQSIGGLNTYTANFTFYKGNYSFNNGTGLTGETYNFLLNLTNGTNIVDFQANFKYNNVIYDTQKSVYSGYTTFNITIDVPITPALYNFTWNINVSQPTINYSWNFSGSQNAVDFSIDDCSGATNTTFILSYFDENSPANTLTSSLEAYLVFSPNQDFSNSKNYSIERAGATTHSFCIYPLDVPLYTDAWFIYNNSNGFKHRYYLRNVTLTNNTQNYYLFNVNDANLNSNTTTFTDTATNVSTTINYGSRYSTLKLTTRYVSDYSYYKNVITTLQRFYTSDGTWRSVQMDESGEYGTLNFNVLEKNTEYRLLFIERQSTRTLKLTTSMKFVCTNTLCDLTYLLNPSQAVATPNTLTYNITFFNATKALTLNWSDAVTTKTIRFYVWKSTITGIQDICDTTQVGNGGNVYCNATNYYGRIFAGIYDNNNLISGSNYELNDAKLSNYLPTGEGGFWAMIIMVICLMFGLFSPVGSVITGIIGLIVIYLLGIFNPITFTGIAVASIIGAVIGFKVKA